MCNEHTEIERAAEVLALLDRGDTVTLITDAGTPGISDPGSRLVRVVLDAGHEVSAVPGPAAFVMALVVSGFDTTRFVFEGFLPRSGRERATRARGNRRRVAHDRDVRGTAPCRRGRSTDLVEACGGDRPVALARELTKMYESVWRGSLDDASAHLRSTTPRGEYVIVLQGAPPRPRNQRRRDPSRASQAHSWGIARKDAIEVVVGQLEVPKRRVYDLALSVSRDV